MKVLHVIDRLNAGGAERVCVTLATLFQQRGYNVTVLELLSSGVLQQQLPLTVSAIQLNRKSRFDLMALFRLVTQLRKYDIIHIHMRHVYRYVFLANFFIGKKLVFQDHFNQYPVDWINRILFRCMLKGHIYISVDEYGCQWAIESLRLKSDNVHYLPNVILRRESMSVIRTNALVLVSNIKPEKNIEFIVPLLKALVLEKKHIHIDIIGNIIDSVYFNSIVQQLRVFGLEHHVSFRTNVFDVQTELREYVLGLHFSKRESGPLVLLEYLAQNLPFLAFLTGEIGKKIQRDLPDFFVQNHDVENWCKQIDKNLTTKLHTPSLEYFFKKHNDTDQYYKKCLRIYQKI